MSLENVKQEHEWGVSEEAARAGLYEKHEIRNGLVLGPVVLQLPDVAFKINGHGTVNDIKREKEAFTSNMRSPTTTGPHVKSEPQWGDEWGTAAFCADQKVKKELLESQDLETRNYNLIGLQQIKSKTVKQEAQDTGNTSDPTDMQMENKILLKTKGLECKKNTKLSTQITKPNQIIVRSASRIRYEEDSDTEEEIKEIKPKKIQKKCARPKKIHKCEYCGKVFSFRAVLTNHIRIHTGEKPFSCPMCFKKFSDIAVLIRHRRVHTGEKPHECDVCGKKYSEKYLLKNHKLVHTGEMKYFCKECPKSFVNSSNFRRHQWVHNHKYTCDICQKKFAKKPALVSHINNHMKPKPYKCDFCDKMFCNSGHLNRHLVIHKGSNEVYICGVCKKEFSQHCSLKKHVTRKVCLKNKLTIKSENGSKTKKRI